MIRFCMTHILLIVLFGISSGHINQIPEYVLEELRNSRTLQEVTEKMYARHGISLPNYSIRTAGPQWSTRHQAKSSGQRTQHVGMDEIHAVHAAAVEIIDNPTQSRDSCTLYNICVALPMDKQPDTFNFPECIDLPQCLGACCDNSRDCRPTETQMVKVKVTVWKYKGVADGRHNFVPENNTLAEVKRHLRCKCDGCLVKPTCRDRQQLVGCKCECNNRDEQLACTGENRTWNENGCFCDCKRKTCDDGYYLSETECKCVPSRHGFHQPSPGTDGD